MSSSYGGKMPIHTSLVGDFASTLSPWSTTTGKTKLPSWEHLGYNNVIVSCTKGSSDWFIHQDITLFKKLPKPGLFFMVLHYMFDVSIGHKQFKSNILPLCTRCVAYTDCHLPLLHSPIKGYNLLHHEICSVYV